MGLQGEADFTGACTAFLMQQKNTVLRKVLLNSSHTNCPPRSSGISLPSSPAVQKKERGRLPPERERGPCHHPSYSFPVAGNIFGWKRGNNTGCSSSFSISK